MKLIKRHLEWFAFTLGLILLALMDPTIQGHSFCFFDFIGISFCPGEGLGHSIAYTFRGSLESALEANYMGPFAVLILSFRILQIWHQLFITNNTDTKEIENG